MNEIVLTPTTNFDRKLARLQQQRIWEHLPAAIDLDVAIAGKAMELANDADCPRGTRLLAWRLAHSIIKETFLDRTIPIVSRVEFDDIVGKLNPSRDEAEQASNSSDPEADARNNFITMLKDAADKRRIGIVMPIDGGKRAVNG